MPNLEPMLAVGKEKLLEAKSLSIYYKKKTQEKDDEIEIIIEAIRRLEKE